MSDLIERAFDEFAEATEATVLRLANEVQSLRADLAAMREEHRNTLHEVRQAEPVQGPPGPRGEDGADGADGRGIEAAELRGGDLIFRLTDGSEINVGRVTGERGPQGERGEKGDPGERGADGAPGVGVERVRLVEGRLEIRLSDGQEVDLGRVVGEKGEKGDPGERGADGQDGRDGAPGERGEPGPKGEDGIATREELDALVEARFRDVQARTLADLYRGVYRNGETYARGDLVTWGGSLFLALSDTRAKPETDDWRLITKRGRDGRDRT